MLSIVYYCVPKGRNGVRNAASEAAVHAVQTPRPVEQGIPREVGLARPKGGKLGEALHFHHILVSL